MNWNNWSVAKRLLCTVLSLFGLLLAVGAGTQWEIYRSNQAALSAVSEFDARLVAAVRWRGLAEVSAERAMAALGTTDGDLLVAYEKSVADSERQVDAIRTELESKVVSDRDRAAFAELATSRSKLQQLLKQGGVLSGKGDIGGVQALVQSQITPAVAAALADVDKFIEVQAAQREDVIAQTQLQSQRLAGLAFAACAALLLLGLGFTYLLVRSISLPLREAVRLAEGIADGDLCAIVKTSRRDELGQLLRAVDRMAERLREIVSEVRLGVESVSTASREIAAGTQELSERTEDAANRLQSTASSVEQLTASVATSADAAKQADRLASEATGSAAAGGRLVQEVVSQMELIAKASKKIVDITTLIDGIAAQTRLLAMNAAVEAARAGEHGRGFAVVAQEVQMLAKRSAEASKDIRGLTENVASFVAVGAQLVNRTDTAMKQIVGNATTVGVLVGEISNATGQQHAGLDIVNRSVGEMDDVTQQNAALVEESAAAAVALSEQAQRLAELVAVFRLPPNNHIKKLASPLGALP
ncbi:MAG: hypothetical protein A2Z90_14240 [Burkholderiales bacterium GWA2_64_37]|nr:MAG: hypothetical protein A2Z90_14240 [Burkholderiales bacterium GWA2_64_37]